MTPIIVKACRMRIAAWRRDSTIRGSPPAAPSTPADRLTAMLADRLTAMLADRSTAMQGGRLTVMRGGLLTPMAGDRSKTALLGA
jgi:hypothetical protein